VGVPRFSPTPVLLSLAIACGVPAIAQGQLPSDAATLSPNQAARGERVTITLDKKNAHFVQGETIAKFGEGIAVGDGSEGEFGRVRVLSSERVSIDLIIDSDADLDERTVVIRTRTERFVLSDIFTVTRRSDVPPQFTLTPDRAPAGQLITVVITGDRTHFKQGLTVAHFGDGVQVGGQSLGAFGPVNVISATEARARLFIDRDTYVGSRTVVVQTGDERISKHDSFDVLPGSTQFTVTPDTGARGQKLSVLIHAPGGHFEQGITEARFGSGIIVGDEECFGNVTVLSPTDARADIRIRPRAIIGPRSVTIRTRRERLFVRHVFQVVASPPSVPTIASITPNSGRQGQNLQITVAGQFTHFSQNSTQIGLGAGMAITGLTVSSPTSLVAQLSVAGNAALGVRSLTVTTGAESAALADAFTVTAGTAALTTLQPATSQQGQVLTLTVSGEFTHFGSGTQVNFGSGVSVNNVNVLGPSSLTAQVSINKSAIAGFRTVTVTSGSEVVSLADALTVAPGPVINATVSPAPNSAGWYNSDVTVHFMCSDDGSGVASCEADKIVSTERANQLVSGTVVNNAGVSATTSVTINLDKTAPAIVFSSPTAGTALFVPGVTATAGVTDALSGVAGADCGGNAGALAGGAIDCSLTLTPGVNTVTVNATDIAGNARSATLPLTYARPPTVTITSPANLAYLSLSPTTVTGTVDDPTAIVTVNSLPAPASNGSFSITLPIAEGPTIIAAAATSPSGAVGTASITVTLDTTAPHISITSPPDRFRTTAETIAVAGIVNDTVVGTVNDEQAQVTVNGQPAQVGNRTFLTSSIALAVGDNVIEAVGRDRVGNIATTRINVTRDPPTQPHILIVSGGNQTGPIGSPLSSPLVVALVDGAGNPAPGVPVIFKVTQDDGVLSDGVSSAATILAITDSQGRALSRWTLGHRAGAGSDAVEAYAVGFEGTALFMASASQGAPGKIVVDSGNEQVGAVGRPLPKPFIAVVIDGGNNRLAGVPVTFTVLEGGGHVEGESSKTVITDSDGRAAITLTLGLQEGNANNVIAATFPTNDGFPAAFTASGRVPGNPAATTISGVVLDNNNIPIQGVTLRAVLTSALNNNRSVIPSVAAVQTDASGQFSISNAPVGYVKLLVDGLTAQREGVYPALEYDMVTIAGQDNSVGQPIYLLPLNTANQLCVTATSGGGRLTIPEAPGFSLTVNPGQVTFPGGTQTGCVTVTVVHGDKVPMQPGFGQQPRFIVTIQPSGAMFNPPAAITLPNVDGLKPREVTEMYSFDHDIGSFVAIGTGTVSDDGLLIRSNPGVGVLKSGWHCGGNPTASGTAANCPTCSACNGTSCVPDPSAGACDDGKFCTQNDVCTGGTCIGGNPVPDVPGTPVTISADLDSVLEPVTAFLNTLLGISPSLSLSLDGTVQQDEHCCDLTQGTVTNTTATGTATASIGTGDIPIPGLAVTLPFGIHAGLFANVTLSASASLSGTLDKCTNTSSGSLGGSVTLTGGISAQFALPAGLADASVGGTIGAGCSFTGPIQPGSIPCTGTCATTGIVVTVEATFIGAVIKTDASFVLLPPNQLGTISFSIPSPF